MRVDSCETSKTADHSLRGVVLFVCERENERKALICAVLLSSSLLLLRVEESHIETRVMVGLTKGFEENLPKVIARTPSVVMRRYQRTDLAQSMKRYAGKVVMFAVIIGAQRQQGIPPTGIG